jgi:3-hydroxyisobutyrate dehydrogenase-like beta-hydroxyacid dehydrogenase
MRGGDATVGIISPGAMGSALGRVVSAGGVRVVATVAGRSPRTRQLALASGLELVESLDGLVAESETILSVVPPGEAEAVARALAEACRRTGIAPLVADLNAVSPATVQAVATELARAGAELVDGAISGPPPTAGRPATRVYLSGLRASEVASLFAAPGAAARVLGPAIGTASALKMCTASMYKGLSALGMHALLTAREHGLVEEVLEDLAQSLPELASGLPRSIALAATKSGRYVAEMHEIAATQAAAGLTPALFDGIAEVFARAATSALAAREPEDVPPDVELDAALAALAARRPAR